MRFPKLAQVPEQKIEAAQMWLAAVLAVGEWCIATYFFVSHGDVVFLYLTITYVIRDTKGGQHYHDIIAAGIVKLKSHF